jgi:hypothetical protein
MDLNGGQNVAMPEPPFAHLIKEHGSRFDRQEEELRRLRDKLNTLENVMNQFSPLIDRMDADIYNHGQDGLKTRFDKFMAVQEDRHKQNTAKFNYVIALLTVLCAILGVIIAWKGLSHTSQLVTDPFHSGIPLIALSEPMR